MSPVCDGEQPRREASAFVPATKGKSTHSKDRSMRPAAVKGLSQGHPRRVEKSPDPVWIWGLMPSPGPSHVLRWHGVYALTLFWEPHPTIHHQSTLLQSVTYGICIKFTVK